MYLKLSHENLQAKTLYLGRGQMKISHTKNTLHGENENCTNHQKRDQKVSTDASVLSLQKEVQHLKSVIKDMKSLHLHLKEMQNMTKRLESQIEKLEATLAAQERMGKHFIDLFSIQGATLSQKKARERNKVASQKLLFGGISIENSTQQNFLFLGGGPLYSGASTF